jgi:hypothetical protein
MIDRGIRASATLTWKRRKLIGARTITPTAYRAAMTDPNAIILVSNSFTSQPGFLMRNGGRPHHPLC